MVRKMAKQEKIEEEKVYKNKVVFLRRSKAGNHLFIHDNRVDLIGGGTLIMNVSDVEKLIGGGTEWIKVSVLPPESAAEESAKAKEGD
jgi:hypothetical protein